MKNIEKAAPPLELILKGGDPNKVVLWGCGTCHISTATKEQALEHCAPNHCDKCNAEIGNTFCRECQREKEKAKEENQYRDAKKILLSQYTGDMLYCNCCDHYFSEVDEFFDEHDLESAANYLNGTSPIRLELDAEGILENACSDLHDEAYEEFSKEDIMSLQTLLDAWVSLNPVTAYTPDMSTVVFIQLELDEYNKEHRE